MYHSKAQLQVEINWTFLKQKAVIHCSVTFYNLKLGYFHPTLLLRALNDGPQGVRYNESWLYSDQWYILAIFHFWNWPASARQLVCVNQCKRTRFAAKMRRRRRQAPVPIKSISRNIQSNPTISVNWNIKIDRINVQSSRHGNSENFKRTLFTQFFLVFKLFCFENCDTFGKNSKNCCFQPNFKRVFMFSRLKSIKHTCFSHSV